MFKHLWDVSGGSPKFAQVTGLTGAGPATTEIVAAVGATKRIVPVWALYWVEGAGVNSKSDFGLRCDSAILFNGGGGDDNYENLIKAPVMMHFGWSFINRCGLGEALDVMYDIDTTVENGSMIVGYYVI